VPRDSRLGFAADLVAGLIEVSGMIAGTLLFYDIFEAVNRSLSLLAASFNFVGLTLELLQLNPQGVVIGIGFHGFDCLLIGYLIFRSTFLSRILGAPTALADLCWLTFLLPMLTNYLSPYNLASGRTPPTLDTVRQMLSRSKTSTCRDQYIIPFDTQLDVATAGHHG
jgi:hypothetical protein